MHAIGRGGPWMCDGGSGNRVHAQRWEGKYLRDALACNSHEHTFRTSSGKCVHYKQKKKQKQKKSM